MATETLRIKVVGLREINKVNTAVNKLDKAMKAINRQRVTGTKAAVKVLKQELSIKNKILKADKEILKTRVEQGKVNKKNVVTQTGDSGGSGGGGGGGKGSGALSSALISGTFPLLFGQGPLAAAGGFAGGFIGDRLGGKMGGFAGGLVGTATVTIIQNAATAIGEVGQAMSPFVQDINKLVKVTGGSNSAISKQIELVEAAKGKQEAFNVVMKIMERQVGEDGVKALKDFGDTTRLLGSNLDVALTKLGAFTAGIVNFITKITGIQSALQEAETDRIVTAAAATGNEEAQSLLDREKEIEETGFITGSRGTRRKSGTADKERELELDKKIFAARQKLSIEADSLRTKSAGSLADKQKELDLNTRINELVGQGINKNLAKTLATTEQTFDADKEILENKQKQIEAAFKKSIIENADAEVQAQLRRDLVGIGEELRDHNAERAEALKLDKELAEATKGIKSNFELIGQSIASGVSDNLTAAIQGTKTLGEAAKSILSDLSSTLIKLGVNTILGGIAPGIFGGLPKLFGFANGGRPPVGKPSIVGEKGPELFVPRRSGTIIPNDKLGGGGSTNINVNIDASGSSVEGDEQQSKELGRAISAAIQSELLKQRRPGGLLR
mgnify:FL=1